MLTALLQIVSIKKLQPLAALLQSGDLGELVAEAQRRQNLTERIRDLLPADEAAHLVSASTDSGGVLVLVMDASVWAARVRYRAESLGHDRVKVKVIPLPELPSDSEAS